MSLYLDIPVDIATPTRYHAYGMPPAAGPNDRILWPTLPLPGTASRVRRSRGSEQFAVRAGLSERRVAAITSGELG
ncbi:MAG: hypothetical protein LBV34_01285 [Nocardiopsaceae bacterium]|nr:hypothetical protein [Nocardiopsaceae bacterium]